jgi:protein-S-isoprenylcysteine O-methyltransferase Ste14
MTVARFLERRRTLATGLMPVALLVAAWLTPGLRPRVAWLVAGTAVVAAGEVIRVWAAGHHPKHDALITSGPYAHTRNPLYLGSAVMGVGFCLLSQLWWSWLLVAGVLVAFYLPTVNEEERHLAKVFGDAYQRYIAQVPRFAPRLRAHCAGDDAGERFAWRGVLERDEQMTALWSALPVLAFWLRLLLFHRPEA